MWNALLKEWKYKPQTEGSICKQSLKDYIKNPQNKKTNSTIKNWAKDWADTLRDSMDV